MSFDAIEKYNTRLLIPQKLACSQPLQYFQMDAQRTKPESMGAFHLGKKPRNFGGKKSGISDW